MRRVIGCCYEKDTVSATTEEGVSEHLMNDGEPKQAPVRPGRVVFLGDIAYTT